MRQGAWRYLCEAKAMGLVKAIGLSTHTVEGALLAAELEETDFVQVAFNVIGAGILDGDLAAMEKALQRLKEAGKTVCAIKPLAGGMLSRDRWKEALEFVFTHPCVDCVCVGLLTREEIDAACAFANGELVDEATATTIAQTPRKLVILDWCTGCEACIPVCPTQALYMKDGMARVIHERCDWCGKCGPVCPDEAIFLIANSIIPKEEAE
jgi:predicted aldo/keto reductase-like oxidoreductase